MNELIRKEGRLSALAGLAQEAKFYSERIAANILELGRVLADAKELVEHGRWGEWIRENAQISERTAQACMQAWRRYGENPRFAGIEKGKLFKMLALPEGREEAFIEEHDVPHMTTREVEQAVREARAEERAETEALLAQERKARLDAEARMRAAETQARKGEAPPEVTRELEEQRESARHFADLARKVGGEKAELERRNRELQAQIEQQEDMLREQQEAIHQAQQDLLNLQSSQARGEAEQGEDSLTPAAFRAQVQLFLGSCCMLPQMGRAIGQMSQEERESYTEGLYAVAQWLTGALRAVKGSEEAIVVE